MQRYIIATKKSWNIRLAKEIQKSRPKDCVSVITDEAQLTIDYIEQFAPEYIFFPHWSSIIPANIFENYKCVVFHMTDLPFGRGGSPLQNLISMGITSTVVSAIRVVKQLDAGDIYVKRPLSLYGGAEEIFIRAGELILKEMIPLILDTAPVPVPQKGDVFTFKRRTPEMGELISDMTLEQIFNHIRMLDAEGYPPSFIRFGKYELSFSRPKRLNASILADVVIKEIENDR